MTILECGIECRDVDQCVFLASGIIFLNILYIFFCSLTAFTFRVPTFSIKSSGISENQFYFLLPLMKLFLNCFDSFSFLSNFCPDVQI